MPASALYPTGQSYRYTPGMSNVTTPRHVPSMVPSAWSNANTSGLPKEAPVTVLESPLTPCNPSMLMNATVSPGTTVKLDGVNSKLVTMTLWSASHWAHATEAHTATTMPHEKRKML